MLELSVQRIDVNLLTVHLLQVKFAVRRVYIHRTDILVFTRAVTDPVDAVECFSLPAEEADVVSPMSFGYHILIGDHFYRTVEQKFVVSLQRNIAYVSNILQHDLLFGIIFIHINHRQSLIHCFLAPLTRSQRKGYPKIKRESFHSTNY